MMRYGHVAYAVLGFQMPAGAWRGALPGQGEKPIKVNDVFRMKTQLILTSLLLTLGPVMNAPADDKKAILGTWVGGMPGEPPRSMELTITPTGITGRNPRTGESLGEGTYELDPANHTIDSNRIVKFGRGTKYFGRYALEGDTLRWVSTSHGNKRPADLVHRPERDQFLMVLERTR